MTSRSARQPDPPDVSAAEPDHPHPATGAWSSNTRLQEVVEPFSGLCVDLEKLDAEPMVGIPELFGPDDFAQLPMMGVK